jgi:hypothetical protein
VHAGCLDPARERFPAWDEIASGGVGMAFDEAIAHALG